MKILARDRGGNCISSEYKNAHNYLTWECGLGHHWEARPHDIKHGTWCPYCAGKRKTIKDMNDLAAQQGGLCLSSRYVDGKTKLQWKCASGHMWWARPSDIKRGSWCPDCRGRCPGTIDQMREIAASRGGMCVSHSYINDGTRLEWKCAHGHIWQATPSSIKRGSWCPLCKGRGITIDDMSVLAMSRGGKCLSSNYKNPHTALFWQCKHGHLWKARPNNVRRGSWCPFCVGKHKTIQAMRSLADERAGRCLSHTFKGMRRKLEWECAHRHRWEATPDSVQRGSWCPECADGLGERICRAFFEQLFKKRFPKRRPAWLVNENGNQMELDGFCQSMGIAFEHQGEQHYRPVAPFVSSSAQLDKRLRDDACKKRLCKLNNVNLFIIPQIPQRTRVEDMPKTILDLCHKQGISIPSDFASKHIDLRDAYSAAGPILTLHELKRIAIMKRGECVSTHYVNDTTPLQWKCEFGHLWTATPSNIKRGTWCPRCIGKGKTIHDMQNLAHKHGGKCLSTTYHNSSTKLLWQCDLKHTWEATPTNVIQGSWCPKCGNYTRGNRLRSSIKDMQELARVRGGLCMSKQYTNAHTPLEWECQYGHRWRAIPANIMRNHWCPKCGGSHRKTIADMQALALSHSGRCVSSEYTNNRTKLEWECSYGHRWQAMPGNVQQGQWCPICARTNAHRREK